VKPLGGGRARRGEEQTEEEEDRERREKAASGADRGDQDGLLVGVLETTAAMGQADEDAMSQSLRRGATQAPLADDQEELSGVVHPACAVTTEGHVIPEGREEILFHLVVEEEENHFVDPFAIHHLPPRSLRAFPAVSKRVRPV
jgi:hypothetical protein